MKTSVIRYRVADFLKQFPPFDEVPEEDLLTLAGSGRVQFFESDTYVFQAQQDLKATVWVIQQGTVEILDSTADGETQRDLLGPGDLLGVARLLGHPRYAWSARTASDVILYSLNAEEFEQLAGRHPRMTRYLAAHEAAAGLYEEAAATGRRSWLDTSAPTLQYLMANPGGGSWDGDLKSAVEGGTAGEYFLAMMDAGSDALRLQSANGATAATLSAEDVSLFTGWNPVRLARELRGATAPERWGPLRQAARSMMVSALTEPGAVTLSLRLATGLNGAWLGALLDKVRPAGEAPSPYCWLLVGTAGRGEWLDLPRPEIALVHQQSASPDYFALWASEASALLDSLSIRGEPIRSASLEDWKQHLVRCIENPILQGIYHNRALFDLQPLEGETHLVCELRRSIGLALQQSEAFLPVLANDTLAHLPPMTFFQGLVVELDGEQRETLDLDRTALAPLADAARVLALAESEISTTGTLDRLKAAERAHPETAETLRGASAAFRVATFYRFTARHLDPAEGGRIAPNRLTRHDQRVLKTSFAAIRDFLDWTATRFDRT